MVCEIMCVWLRKMVQLNEMKIGAKHKNSIWMRNWMCEQKRDRKRERENISHVMKKWCSEFFEFHFCLFVIDFDLLFPRFAKIALAFTNLIMLTMFYFKRWILFFFVQFMCANDTIKAQLFCHENQAVFSFLFCANQQISFNEWLACVALLIQYSLHSASFLTISTDLFLVFASNYNCN